MNGRRNEERRRKPRDPANPTLTELRAIFHRLWGSQVGQRGYRKRDWCELQHMIFRVFKVEV